MALAEQIRQIERDRDSFLDRIEQIVAAAEGEERGFNDDEQKQYDEAKRQIDALVLRHKTVSDALELQKHRAPVVQREPLEAHTADDSPAPGQKPAPKPAFGNLARVETL